MNSRNKVPKTKSETNNRPTATFNLRLDKEENANESVLDLTDISSTLSAPKKHERMVRIRYIVQEAKHQKKTFTIRGCYPIIRKALLDRGWIECFYDDPQPKSKALSSPYKRKKTDTRTTDDASTFSINLKNSNLRLRDSETAMASRLLHGHDVDFYWSPKHETIDWTNKNKIINRFPHLPFTTKDGLCLMLQNCHWFNEPGLSEVNFPRCYAMNYEDQAVAFVEDFQLTACVSLLRWFIELYTEGIFDKLRSDKGNIPHTTLLFAVERCNEYVASKEHFDIDMKVTFIWEDEWRAFYRDFNLLVDGKDMFNLSLDIGETGVQEVVENALKNVEEYLPQAHLDGINNLWILKPSNKCRGRDIQIITKIEDALKYTNNKFKYVIQKYIERPLLIYNTKFDIRQWFLVTSIYPLCVWMYRDCYLRFSSKPFSLSNLHESVHLTNHAVQHKYRTIKFDKDLPDDNMWDSGTFKAYLHSIGKDEMWYSKIYPGMRESIVGALLASQDGMESRPNTFELFGADFMIATDYTPWLIEINSCPDMCSTTTVTSKMCPQCFEDIIKVVIDRRVNTNADTGNFQEVYKQENFYKPAYLGTSLSVQGEKVTKKTSNTKFERVRGLSIPLYMQSGVTSSVSSRSRNGFYTRQIHIDKNCELYPDMIESKDTNFIFRKEYRLDYYQIEREVYSDLDFTTREKFSFEKQLRFGKDFRDYGKFSCDEEKDFRCNKDKRFQQVWNDNIKSKCKTVKTSPFERMADHDKKYWVERINKRRRVIKENRFGRNSGTAKDIYTLSTKDLHTAKDFKSVFPAKQEHTTKNIHTVKDVDTATHVYTVKDEYISEGMYTDRGIYTVTDAHTTRDIYTAKDEHTTKDIYTAKDVHTVTDMHKVKDTHTVKDIYIVKDIHTAKDIYTVKDVPTGKDVHTAKDVDTAKDLQTVKDLHLLQDSHTVKDSNTVKNENIAKDANTAKDSYTLKDAHTAKNANTTKDMHTADFSKTGKKSHTLKDSHVTKNANIAKDSHTVKDTHIPTDASTTRNANTAKDSHTVKDSHSVKNSHTAKDAQTAKDANTATDSHIVKDLHTVKDAHTAKDVSITKDTHTTKELHTVKDSYTAKHSHNTIGSYNVENGNITKDPQTTKDAHTSKDSYSFKKSHTTIDLHNVKDTYNTKNPRSTKDTYLVNCSTQSTRIGTDKKIYTTLTGLTTIIPTRQTYTPKDTSSTRKRRTHRSSCLDELNATSKCRLSETPQVSKTGISNPTNKNTSLNKEPHQRTPSSAPEKQIENSDVFATWRQDTVSILQCPRPIQNNANIITELDNTATTQNICDNLFTLDLDYKHNLNNINSPEIVHIHTKPIIELFNS